MRAIISAANRDGLPELARDQQKHGIHIFSTSGTLDYLKTEGIHAESVSTLTQFPEILGGRVKTLHPAILGGILARRDLPEHVDELQTHAIVPIDVVVVNLYPFAETIAQPDTTLSEAQEQIDIGGVTLIRAAAKNFQDVIVLVRPQDYATVMQEWDELGEVSLETRRRLAAIAFQHTANYDTSIAEYLRLPTVDSFPDELTLPLKRIQILRYGENPHQRAAFYRWAETLATSSLPTVAGATILHGKKNLRLLATYCPIEPKSISTQSLHASRPEVRSVSGGLLLQTPDAIGESSPDYSAVTEREPTLEEVTDLMFAWKVVRHVKSNAIVLAHKLAMVGVGAGQMNRVASVQLAVEKSPKRERGSLLASDAFFPFADGVEAAAKAGVTAIIQPGGSIRDEEAIRMANHYAIAMVFTGKRHFRH